VAELLLPLDAKTLEGEECSRSGGNIVVRQRRQRLSGFRSEHRQAAWVGDQSRVLGASGPSINRKLEMNESERSDDARRSRYAHETI